MDGAESLLVSNRASSVMKLPNEIPIRGAGLPHILRSVEDGLKMIDSLPREVSELSRWRFAKALLLEALRSNKSRDLTAATRQLRQAITNERWA
jgi:hypothetical protein